MNRIAYFAELERQDEMLRQMEEEEMRNPPPFDPQKYPPGDIRGYALTPDNHAAPTPLVFGLTDSLTLAQANRFLRDVYLAETEALED